MSALRVLRAMLRKMSISKDGTYVHMVGKHFRIFKCFLIPKGTGLIPYIQLADSWLHKGIKRESPLRIPAHPYRTMHAALSNGSRLSMTKTCLQCHYEGTQNQILLTLERSLRQAYDSLECCCARTSAVRQRFIACWLRTAACASYSGNLGVVSFARPFFAASHPIFIDQSSRFGLSEKA